MPSPPASLTLSHFSTAASRRTTWPACWSTSSTAPFLASPPPATTTSALTEDERRRLDALQRDVLGPLRRLRPVKETVVRILVDGLDQVPSAGEVSIREALGELTAGPGLDHMRSSAPRGLIPTCLAAPTCCGSTRPTTPSSAPT